MGEYTGRIASVTEPYHIQFDTRSYQVGDSDVLIKVRSSAICGSDLHIYKGKHPAVSLPVTIGHEVSGDVVAVGDRVTEISTGDRVTVEPAIVCGQCSECRQGRYGYCEHITFTYRQGDGAMADFVCIPARCIHKIPEALTYDEGALIEPLAVAVHAVRRAEVSLGQSVLVIGDGAIGIMTAAMCAQSGAGIVILAGHSELRLNLSREFGVTNVINSLEEDVLQTTRRLTGGLGVDKTFECVGRKEALDQAVLALKSNGLATIIGIYEQPVVELDVSNIVSHEIRIQGAQGYCWDFPVAIEAAQKLPLHKLISRIYRLEELQKAMDELLDKHKESIKIVVHPQ